MKKIIPAIIFLMALTVSVISAVEVGEKAPNVVLYDTNLQRVELRELFAQPTVLAFVPGAFTGVCTKEFCTFRDQMAEFNELDAQVIGISVDAPFSNAAWSKQNKFGFPVMSDFNREAVKAFDAYHENFAGMEGYTAPKRAVFIVDKEGIIRYKWISDHPGREPNYDEIKAELEKLED